MKAFLFLLLFVECAFTRNTLQKESGRAEGPQCPIDDPLSIPGPISLKVTLDPIVNLYDGSTASDLIVEGLSGLRYTVNVNLITLEANFEVILDSVTGNADYAVSGYIDVSPIPPETIPSGYLSGTGLGKVSATGVHLKGRATLFVNDITTKTNIATLTLEIVSFDYLAVDLGTEFEIEGVKINWNSFNSNIKANFDRDFAKHKNALTEKIRVAANSVIGKYTLDELVDLINNGECGNG